MIDAGVNRSDIHSHGTTDLPGYFRPYKGWDIIVASDDQLYAAIELKSQVGPSFGNNFNFNNRTEEALGTAVDLWTAYREGAFRLSPTPWLGHFLILEDCPRSRQPVGVREPHFPVFDEFRGSSYIKRYELSCQRLVRERPYSGACLLIAQRGLAHRRENYSEPAEDLSANRFLSELLRHVGNLRAGGDSGGN